MQTPWIQAENGCVPSGSRRKLELACGDHRQVILTEEVPGKEGTDIYA